MKMWTLIKQEIRSTLLKPLLVFVLLPGIGHELLMQRKSQAYGIFGVSYSSSDYLNVFSSESVTVFSKVLPIACIALAISVAWVQFGRPSRQNEWGFWLHRPIRRRQLVFAKLTGGALSLLAIPMAAWLAASFSPGISWSSNRLWAPLKPM